MHFITFIQPDGSAQVVDADSGGSLMAYATRDGVQGIEAECGGQMSCGTCHVHIHPDWQAEVGQAQGFERAMLDWRDNFDEAASRLSCQVILTDAMEGMKVLVPSVD